jgi:hypothetical protein
MHRRISFHGDAGALSTLAQQLTSIEGVIGLAHHRGASVKPAGDVLEVDVLNRDADEVLRRAQPHLEATDNALAVVISQSTSMLERAHRHLIETDADEVLWEEMESDLRNHGRISINFLILMTLGGIVSVCGLLMSPVPRAIALVGAAIIAPGFEPLAKLAEGLALRQRRLCLRGLLSVAVGYGALFAAAFVTVFTLSWAGIGEARSALTSEAVRGPLTEIEPIGTLASAGAAVAGIMMVVSLRDFYIVGPLMVLVLISGIALAGGALAVGEGGVALAAVERVGVDVCLLLVLGAGVFYWKQRSFHRRRPLS